MNSKHTSEEKQNIITAYKGGKSIFQLVTETEIPRRTIYAWLADARTIAIFNNTAERFHF